METSVTPTVCMTLAFWLARGRRKVDWAGVWAAAQTTNRATQGRRFRRVFISILSSGMGSGRPSDCSSGARLRANFPGEGWPASLDLGAPPMVAKSARPVFTQM
jgi:hypothetical protein